MNLIFDKNQLLTHIKTAQEFTANKLMSTQALQGAYLTTKKGKLHIYSSDLNSYFHTIIKKNIASDIDIIIEPKKIIEFIQLLKAGDIELVVETNLISIRQGKTKGTFPCIVTEGFPLPPTITEEVKKIKTTFLSENLPKLLYSASADDARPILTGLNIVSSDNELVFVATDGFRLSIVREKQEGNIPSMIIPADFLKKVLGYIKGKDSIKFSYSQKEKLVRLSSNDMEFYTRLIDGEFPPYKRVLPEEKKTTAIINREELIRNTKLISVFARDYSNVILYDFSDNMLRLSPKKEANDGNVSTQDIQLKGDPQRVTFNYRYILDFLSSVDGEDVIVEILRPDAPIVFKSPEDKTYTHVIMPVRTQE